MNVYSPYYIHAWYSILYYVFVCVCIRMYVYTYISVNGHIHNVIMVQIYLLEHCFQFKSMGGGGIYSIVRTLSSLINAW